MKYFMLFRKKVTGARRRLEFETREDYFEALACLASYGSDVLLDAGRIQ